MQGNKGSQLVIEHSCFYHMSTLYTMDPCPQRILTKVVEGLKVGTALEMLCTERLKHIIYALVLTNTQAKQSISETF